MLAWKDIQSWNAPRIAALADRLAGSATELQQQAQALRDAVDQLEWNGDAADAARAALGALHEDYQDRTAELCRVGRCVAGMADSMYPLSALVRDCDDTAKTNTMEVDAAGHVADALIAYTTASGDAWDLARDRTRLRREIEERVRAALIRATEIDHDAAADIARSDELRIPAEQHGPANMSKLGTAPANAAYWATLTPSQRTRLVLEQPGAIGNLDGIPAGVRDAANRRMLILERTRLLGVAADLQAQLDGNMFGGMFDNADAGLAETHERLAALDAIAETLARGNRQLLVLDNSSADETLAAIAVGNVNTATHVAVFVPGLDSDVAGDIGRYDGNMEDLEAAVQQALPSGESAACVTWMNYRAPSLGWSLLDPRSTVISPTAAALGAPRLTGFLDGLDASRSQDPHLSLLGHSYGSITAALATKGVDTAGVDELVTLGSPGLGIDRIDSISVPPQHVFVGEAAGDVIADLGVFGGDPSEKPGVVSLGTDSPDYLPPSRGHSEYLTDGTATQRNVALVVAGRSAEITG